MPDTVNGVAENWTGKIVEHARAIANSSEPKSKLDGFIIIGFFDDGRSSIGFRMPARIPACLAPAYVTELVRRDFVVEREAMRVFDDKFE